MGPAPALSTRYLRYEKVYTAMGGARVDYFDDCLLTYYCDLAVECADST